MDEQVLVQIRGMEGDPEALAAVAEALGDAAGKVVLLASRVGEAGPGELHRLSASLSAALGVGLILVERPTLALMRRLARLVDPVVQEHEKELAARVSMAEAVREAGARVTVVHLRAQNHQCEGLAARAGVTLALVAEVVNGQWELFVGVAYCHPRDGYNRRTGANLAIDRALKARVGLPSKYGFRVPKSTDAVAGLSKFLLTSTVGLTWSPWAWCLYRRATTDDRRVGEPLHQGRHVFVGSHVEAARHLLEGEAPKLTQ